MLIRLNSTMGEQPGIHAITVDLLADVTVRDALTQTPKTPSYILC